MWAAKRPMDLSVPRVHKGILAPLDRKGRRGTPALRANRDHRVYKDNKANRDCKAWKDRKDPKDWKDPKDRKGHKDCKGHKGCKDRKDRRACPSSSADISMHPQVTWAPMEQA